MDISILLALQDFRNGGGAIRKELPRTSVGASAF